MIRHLSTGQVCRALRSACLPLFCLLFLPLVLSAQNAGSPTATVATVASNAGTDDDDGKGAAHPAPEPDTWMLLGTGTVVLLLLYTRRRVRVLTPRTAQHQT
jgi:PEP-CTERM motif